MTTMLGERRRRVLEERRSIGTIGFGLVAAGVGYLAYDALTDDNNCSAIDRAKNKLDPVNERARRDQATLDESFGEQGQ